MDRKTVKKALQCILTDDYVYSEEYQDIYYLSKAIREKIPELNDETVYSAIVFANNSVKTPRKSSKFIEAFLTKIAV